MKKWKGLLACSLTVFLSVVSVLAHYETTPPRVSPWAQAEIVRAMELGLTTDFYYPEEADFSQPITREIFLEMAMAYVALEQNGHADQLKLMILAYLVEEDSNSGTSYYGKQIKVAFSDCVAATMSHAIGLVEGRGDGIFDPFGSVTRQEAAVILTRAYQAVGGALPEETNQIEFLDDEKIADWAKDRVHALAQWGVMQGVTDGVFDPDSKLSIEQCVISFLRLHEKAPVSRDRGGVIPLFTYEQALDYVKSLGSVAQQIEGQTATFLHLDHEGAWQEESEFYLVNRSSGGVMMIDLGVCDTPLGATPALLLNDPRFSEDGTFFLCEITLEEDLISYYVDPEGILIHKKGIYQIMVDVETGKTQTLCES